MMTYSISQDLKDSLRRYVEHGIPTGGFLDAVLSNNLMEAMGRADLTNRHDLFNICSYVYNELPARSHGSPERVRAWIDDAIRRRATEDDDDDNQ